MPEYLAPGVYVEEIEMGPSSIEGVSTSTTGLIGETERGPVSPTLITGLEEYRRIFGAYGWSMGGTPAGNPSTSVMRHAVEGFFVNGGKRAFVARVVGAGAKSAFCIIAGAPPTAAAEEAAAKEASDKADQAEATAKKLHDDANTKAQAVIEARNKATTARKELTAAQKAGAADTDAKARASDEADAARDAARELAGVAEAAAKVAEASAKALRDAANRAQAAAGAARDPGGTGDTGTGGAGKPKGPPTFKITAIGPGAWGNNVYIRVGYATLRRQKPKFFAMLIEYRNPDPNGRFKIWASESYDNLSPDPLDPNYVLNSINGMSHLVKVEQSGELPSEQDKIEYQLSKHTEGADGDPIDLGSYTGENYDPPPPEDDPEAPKRIGLSAFEEIDEISIVCAPNENDIPGLTDALVSHCSNLKNRFAILQATRLSKPVAELNPPTDTDYAAYYTPWLRVIDGQTDLPRTIPPCGHLAGIYARSDIERGVFKAPANEVVRGIIGLDSTILAGDQEILNPRGVNCIRALPGRGIRVWGARTMSSDPLRKYVNVRRLLIYIEESIRRGTQWVVFEPNNEALWDRLRQTVSDFLVTVWRDGGLMGRTREEAFFVKCDRTTMTENDLENGRVIVVIGVALVRPAEFVIFRIAQWQGGSSVET